MGQSQSRGQSSTRRLSSLVSSSVLPEATVPSHASEATQQAQLAVAEEHSSADEPQTPEVIPPSPSTETKRSKRRSWLSLGSGRKPSSGAGHGAASSVSKRRWRRSSRVPVEVSDLNESAADDAPVVEQTASGSATDSPTSLAIKANGSADNVANVADVDTGASVAAQPTSSMSGAVEEPPMHESPSHETPSPPPIDEQTPTIAAEPSSGPESDVPHDNTGDSDQQPAEQRHFPPAGTLVVVQGVVHTTDVPRRSIDSEQPPSTLPVSAPPTPSTPTHSLPPPSGRRSLSISRSSTPTPAPRSESTGRRNRLSALISGSRRSSLLGPRRESDSTVSGVTQPHVDTANEIGSGSVSSASEEATPVAETPSSAIPGAEPRAHPEEQPTSTATPSDGQGPRSTAPAVDHVSPNPRRSTLSPGSIDVLGTLLSVAAAATAASLVTGSSDPLSTFRTGFGNGVLPAATGMPNSPSSPLPLPARPSSPSAPERPLSPTPTAGLGLGGLGLGGLNSLPNTRSEEPESDRGRRSRVRSSWGGLRERLGLTQALSAPGAGTSDSTPSSPRHSISGPPVAPRTPTSGAVDTGLGSFTEAAGTQGTSSTTQSPSLDPRERMLRDMARALSQGLGIPDRNGGANAGTGNSMGVANIQWPPSTSSPTEQNGPPAPPPPEGSFERFLVDLQADLRTALSEDRDGDEARTPVATSGETPRENGERPRTSVDSLEDILPESARRPTDGDSDSMPSLNSVSDSESEEEIEDEAGTDESRGMEFEDFSTRPNRASEPSTSATVPGTTHRRIEGNTTRRPGGGINWWRLYRFPPMASPSSQSQGVAASPNANANPRSQSAAAPEVLTGGRGVSGANAEAPRTTLPQPIGANMIVPVIVVGLQSVNADGGQQNQQPSLDATPSRPDTPIAEGLDDNAQYGDAVNPRRQSWRNALSRLRPHRHSTGSNATRPSQNTGSRTFLIYVIGGYYPPNHHMVTGSDNLDSFEALLELAELLGQVKPPTVTREEIEKSGLEVIKPSDLERWEKEGKVASNCVDRCLICLDDYFPEDDLRVMSCKHTFHKNCVDKWLETGRNNCPACRSKGVSTSSDSPSNPTTPISPAPRVI